MSLRSVANPLACTHQTARACIGAGAQSAAQRQAAARLVMHMLRPTAQEAGRWSFRGAGHVAGDIGGRRRAGNCRVDSWVVWPKRFEHVAINCRACKAVRPVGLNECRDVHSRWPSTSERPLLEPANLRWGPRLCGSARRHLRTKTCGDQRICPLLFGSEGRSRACASTVATSESRKAALNRLPALLETRAQVRVALAKLDR